MSARGTLLSLVLRAAPPADADAALLARFVRDRDALAFEGLVRRYAPLVAGVCRRRLGTGPDADDAFQATFLVLARDAGRISTPAALPGWLYRVAYQVAGKAFARRKPVALADDPADGKADAPDESAAGRELRMLLDAELAALPEKQRAVAVLCLVEGRTAPEVAAVLGVPVGTVESRLHHARKALQAGLTRRGVTAAAATAALAGGAETATGLDRLVSLVVAAVADGGVIPESITDLVHGVTTMIPTKTKLLAAGLVSLGLLGTAAGVFQAGGDKPKKEPDAKPTAKADRPAKPPEPDTKPTTPTAAGGKADEFIRQTLVQFDRPAQGFPTEDIPFGQFLEWYNDTFAARVRIGDHEFKAAGNMSVADEKVRLLKGTNLTAGDVLREAIAQVNQVNGGARLTVVGKQLVIVPNGGVDAVDQTDGVPNKSYGLPAATDPTVLYTADEKPLTAVLDDLRRQTGATIILDQRCKTSAERPVSGTFNAVRLATVLHLLGDMCELTLVPVGGTFYLTTPSNAAAMRTAEPPPPPGKGK